MALLTASCGGGDRTATKAGEVQAGTIADTVAAPANTSVEWLDSTLDFGRVREGETVEARFRFRNTGTHPLVISNVSPSCGCTVAEKPVEPIAPGTEGVIRASFDSRGRPGPNHKTLNVYSNTPEGMHQLVFTVEVLGKK
jgi:hypothetical protein